MQLDEDLAFGWDPPWQDEQELNRELWGLTRVALRNWLKPLRWRPVKIVCLEIALMSTSCRAGGQTQRCRGQARARFLKTADEKSSWCLVSQVTSSCRVRMRATLSRH
jgi:hypothetical protein